MLKSVAFKKEIDDVALALSSAGLLVRMPTRTIPSPFGTKTDSKRSKNLFNRFRMPLQCCHRAPTMISTWVEGVVRDDPARGSMIRDLLGECVTAEYDRLQHLVDRAKQNQLTWYDRISMRTMFRPGWLCIRAVRRDVKAAQHRHPSTKDYESGNRND